MATPPHRPIQAFECVFDYIIMLYGYENGGVGEKSKLIECSVAELDAHLQKLLGGI